MGVDFCSKTLHIHITMITLYYLHYCFTRRHMKPFQFFSTNQDGTTATKLCKVALPADGTVLCLLSARRLAVGGHTGGLISDTLQAPI